MSGVLVEVPRLRNYKLCCMVSLQWNGGDSHLKKWGRCPKLQVYVNCQRHNRLINGHFPEMKRDKNGSSELK